MSSEPNDVVTRAAAAGDVAATLQEAVDAGFTGAAEVAGGGVRGRVYLDNGRIYWAAVDGEADVAELVSHLPVNGIILSRIKWRMASGSTLADALEGMDDVDHGAVWLAVQEATEACCRRLLASGGEVTLVGGDAASVGMIATTPLPVAGRDAAPVGVPGPSGTVRLATRLAGRLVQLDETEWRVLAALAAPVDVATVAERSGLPVEHVEAAIARMRLRRLVEGPSATGAVQAVAAPPPAPAAPASSAPAAASSTPAAAAPAASSAPADAAVEAAVDAPTAPVAPGGVPTVAERPTSDGPPASAGAGAASADRRSTALRRLISAVRRI